MSFNKYVRRTLMAFIIVVQIILICTINSYASNMVCFGIGSTNVSKDAENAEITISITENCGFAAADITIVSELEIESIEDIGINSVSNCENGKVNWSGVRNSYATGDILKISFTIPVDAKEGDFWEVSLIVTEIINENIEPVAYSVSKGKVSIDSFKPIYNNYGEKLTINYKQKDCIFIAYNSGNEENVNVKWSSSNEKVAVVDIKGFVTTKGIGTTNIISTDGNGLSASTELTVKYSFLQWLIIVFLFGWLWY